MRTIALLAIAICGCRATPTAITAGTFDASPSPSHSASPPTSTPMAVATEAATPMAMAMPSQVAEDGSWPVVMTLDEAEREVLSWSIPEIGARIERSAYVLKADMVAALDPDGSGLVLRGDQRDFAAQKHYGDPIIMVEVSQPGMDELVTDRFTSTGLPGSVCLPASPGGTMTVVFDGGPGWHLGYLFEAAPEPLWASAETSPLTVYPVTATPYPTDSTPYVPSRFSPKPTATTASLQSAEEPRTLGEGEVPEALREAIGILPWVVGSRWTYRTTSVQDGLRWSTGTVTESVVGARRIAADMIEVHLARTPGEDNPWPSGWLDTDVALIMPSGVLVGSGAERSVDGLRSRMASLAAGERRWTRDDPVALLRWPFKVPDSTNYWWHLAVTGPLSTQVGRFPACYGIDGIINAAYVSRHWFCPGVGFVLHDMPGGAVDAYSNCHYSVWELMDYHIPKITTLP